MIHHMEGQSRELSRFVSALAYDDLPPEVVTKAKELFIDWLGSALAGKASRAVAGFGAFTDAMGPQNGSSTILVNRKRTSPFFAALVNGASCHVIEQDDVHNGSVFHPAAVVFPAVLAMAEAENSSGRRFIEVVVAGYEVGIRLGEAFGRTHYEMFHTTGTAGTAASAAAVAKLIGLDKEGIGHAIGTAGTQAAGLWEFLRDAADSKQVHTAKAAVDGLLSAVLARSGVTGARAIIEGAAACWPACRGALMRGTDAGPRHALGDPGNVAEVARLLPPHASRRRCTPAGHGARASGGRRHSRHHGACPSRRNRVLGAVTHPVSVHQAKFCMGSVLGLIAVNGRADLTGFDGEALTNPDVTGFLDRVVMVVDDEVDAAYPKKWISKVTVRTRDGRTLTGRVDDPKGDPENPLDDAAVKAKAMRLAAYGGTATRAGDGCPDPPHRHPGTAEHAPSISSGRPDKGLRCRRHYLALQTPFGMEL